MSSVNLLIFGTVLFDCADNFLISSATTPNPRPASPALAASMLSKGLDFSMLLEYTSFKEVIKFLNSIFKQYSELPMIPNTFHTFYTEYLFVYNIVFIRTIETGNIALVSGPILPFFPNERSIEVILKNNGLSIYKKYELIEILNSIPLVSNERIYQLGKLLLELTNVNIKSWDSSIQELHGKKIIEDKNNLNDIENIKCIDYEYNTHREFYKFCIKLKDKITHGDENGIIDLIDEHRDLFWNVKSINDNNRVLKNICVIIYSIACNWSIQSNVPYEQIFTNLWKSIIKLEKLNSTNEIIALMTSVTIMKIILIQYLRNLKDLLHWNIAIV